MAKTNDRRSDANRRHRIRLTDYRQKPPSNRGFFIFLDAAKTIFYFLARFRSKSYAQAVLFDMVYFYYKFKVAFFWLGSIKYINKNMRNKIILSIVFASLFLSAGVSFAATTTATSTPAQVVTVATVNVQNAKIVSQTGNQITVNFDLTNRVGAQPQIKYGIMVIQQVNSSTQILADEKIYSDVVSLTANDQKNITVTYDAPSFLSGQYLIVVEAKNEDGFPFGSTPAGTVTFQGTGQSLAIVSDSCYLTVSDDASNTRYTLTQGVDVNPSEDLIAHCDVQSSFQSNTSAVPSFVTHYRDAFGAVVGTQNQDPIAFFAATTTAASFVIPKATVPQAYDAILTFLDGKGNAISNSVTFHYVLHGESATIQNVVFDKDSYQKGDTAKISFLWSGSADSFPGSRLGMTTTTATLALQVNDGNGNPCAAPYAMPLSEQNGLENISVAITNNCQNPTAVVAIMNASGTILAQNDFSVATKPANAASVWTTIGFIVLIILLAALALFLLLRRKKGAMGSAGTMMIMFFLIAGGVIMFGRPAKADTFAVSSPSSINSNSGDNVQNYFTANLDKSSYDPGSPITVTGSATVSWCANSGYSISYSATANGSTGYFLNSSDYYGENSASFSSLSFAAPSTPGNYTVHLSVSISTGARVAHIIPAHILTTYSSGGEIRSCYRNRHGQTRCYAYYDRTARIAHTILVPTSTEYLYYVAACNNGTCNHGASYQNSSVQFSVTGGLNIPYAVAASTQPASTQPASTQPASTQPVCSPSSVTNGTVSPSPSCAITCNLGYTLSGTSCVAATPVINTFLADDMSNPTIVLPQHATLQWSTSNVTSCTLNEISVGTNESSYPIYPSATTKYILSCSGPGGSITGNQTVIVANPTTQEVAP